MKISNILTSIQSVQRNSEINILLELNNDYSLLIEGSFRLLKKGNQVLSSDEYTKSNFASNLFTLISSHLSEKRIVAAKIDEKSGSIAFELENNVWFESFYGEEDFSVWELQKSGVLICSSQCGSIVYA